MAEAAWGQQDVSDLLQLDDGDEPATEEPKLLTPSDVLDMAAYLEIDTVNEIWLFPLARDAVLAELPGGWVEKLDENEDPYYVNKALGITTDEHPTDEKYRRKVAKARKRGPPETVSKWMDFMDENNRRFFYNFEKNIAKYESLEERAAPAPAGIAQGDGPLTPQPPPADTRTPVSGQRSGWATPDGSRADPPGSGGTSRFSQLRDLPLQDADPDPEDQDDEGGFVDNAHGMNRMMMTSDIGAALGEIEELDDELVERAEALGVTPHSEPALMWIVHDSLERLHVLPDGWAVEQDDDSSDGLPLYSCPAAGVSNQTAHPLDEFYRFGVMLCRRKDLRPQIDGLDPAALTAELDEAAKKYKALKKRLRRVEGERNDKEEELQLVQTEYWDLKKTGKKRDAEVADLQAQNINLSTELRAMRRELSADGADGGTAIAAGEGLAAAAVVAAVPTPTATAKATSVDEAQFAAMKKELAQLKSRNRQLEAMQSSQFNAGASQPAAAPLVAKLRPKLTAEEEEKLEFVQDLGGVAKVRQLLHQSDDPEIKETARELLATLPDNAEEILAERKNAAHINAGAEDGKSSESTPENVGGQWKMIAEERSAAAEAANNRVTELEVQLKKAKKQVKALQSIAQTDGDTASSDAAVRAIDSLAHNGSKELETTQAARQSAEKRCEALEVQLKSQQELVRSLGLEVKRSEAALGAASAKGKGKEQAAAAAAAAQETIAAMENKLEQERQTWKQAETMLRDANAADVKRLQDKLDSQSAELSALEASVAAAAEARGDAVQSLKSTRQDLETETAARKAAQARADDAAGKLATTDAKLQAALGAAKTQSQYLIKLARELKNIRATFNEISAAVALHRTVHFESVLKLVTTAAMPAPEVAKAMAGIETDAARRLPELMVERKRLQNEIQELRGNIRVIARVRPLSEKEKAAGEAECVSFPASGELAITNEKQRTIDFEYDFVARQDCGQVEVFKEIRAVAQSVLDGYNCCIFAYGQTGSGKTHTMTGTSSDPGVNVRLVEELFAISAKAWTGHVYTFRVSMVELYNEALRDLLAAPSSKKDVAKADKKASLDVRLNQDGRLEVVGLEEAVCSSAVEAQEVMQAGLKNRAVGATAMNDSSSRSHLVMTIRCDSHNAQTGRGSCSKLHLVDLAGSERLSRTEATGDRLKEAQSINKSLSSLGDVMAALARKDKHVPYRNSKLTYFLQDSLGGDSKTVMFVNISPTLTSAQETVRNIVRTRMAAEASLCVVATVPAFRITHLQSYIRRETSLRFASRVRKVELGPAKKQSKGGSAELSAAAKAKYEALVGTKEQQVLQLQQELTAVKTRLKMVEAGKSGGGGKRPSASGRAQVSGLPPATKQSAPQSHGQMGVRIPQGGWATGPGELSLEQFMSSAIAGSPNKPMPGAPPGVGPRGRRIIR